MRCDPALIGRIETAAARVNLATVEAFVARDRGNPARAGLFGSGALIALGPGRYVNRAVGLSLDDLDDDALDELEAFFAVAEVPASLEVTSWAAPALLTRLAARGYTVDWFRNVYVADLAERPAVERPAMAVEVVTDQTLDDWLGVLRKGNGMTTSETATISDDFARAVHTVAGATDYVVRLDGTPAGCGSLVRESGIGWLGGAATVPAQRRRGVQGALVPVRMAAASEDGCDLAVATAMPAGGSARNLSRLGFTLVYSQAVLTQTVR